MILNPAIVSQKVEEKFTKACLSSIVTEAFINALPLTKEEVVAESATYCAYINAIMNSLHSEKMLDNALESCKGDIHATTYLSELKSMIRSVAAPAAHRVAMEMTEAIPMSEVVNNAKFTPEELKKFAAKGKEIGIEQLSNIIKKKVITTIKDEKAAADANKKLEEEVKDTLEKTLGESAPSVESYMDVVLAKGDARKHISFFSKLQDVCMEHYMLYSNEDLDTETPSLESMLSVTINNTLDCFDKKCLSASESITLLSQAIESVGASEDEEAMRERIHKCGKKSLILAIVILTVMETLKTMRLFSPELSHVKNFVDTPTSGPSVADLNIGQKVHNQIQSIRGMIKEHSVNRVELTQALDALTSLKSELSTIPDEKLPNKEAIMNEITEACKSIMASEAAIVTPDDPMAILSHYATLARENNISELHKAARIMFRNNSVKNVRILVNSTAPSSKENVIKVEGLNETGMPVDVISIQITLLPEFGSLVNEIKTAARLSPFVDHNANTCIYFTDKCYSTPILDLDDSEEDE